MSALYPDEAKLVERLQGFVDACSGHDITLYEGHPAVLVGEAIAAIIRSAEERERLRGETYLASAEAAEFHRDNAIKMWDDERKLRTAAESLAAQALRERDEAREALSQLLRAEYDGPGLRDCTDNDGVAYQSADLAKHIATAETLVGSALSEQPDKERT